MTYYELAVFSKENAAHRFVLDTSLHGLAKALELLEAGLATGQVKFAKPEQASKDWVGIYDELLVEGAYVVELLQAVPTKRPLPFDVQPDLFYEVMPMEM